MKIKKKSQPGMVFDGITGQLVQSSIPQDPPDDIPSIVERYIGLVGKVIGAMEAKARENGLETKDINSIAALGRPVAMLQAVEEAKISRVGGRAIKDLPTSQLHKLLSKQNQEESEQTPDEEA